MSEIVEHYERLYREEQRLRSGVGELEFLRTQEILKRRLPLVPARILDVGGGPGAYAAWLASLGYEVHLVDAVPRHVEQARTCAGLASAELGDARRLQHAAGSFDAVLLLGPLYHLTGRDDRVAALREAWRVLREGGLVWAAAISRFASLLDGLHTGAIDDPQFRAILHRDLEDGQHRNDTGNPEYFTTAFFHHPRELETELAEAGFAVLEVIAVEGPTWLARDFDARWADPARREDLLTLARAVESDPALLGVSLHITAAGRKP